MAWKLRQFSLAFLFVLTFVVAIALAIARVSMSLPFPLVERAFPVLIFILAVLRFTLRDYEPLGARIRAFIAGAGFTAWAVETLVTRATMPSGQLSLGSGIMLAILAGMWIALIVWQFYDFPGGWRLGIACHDDTPARIDDHSTPWRI